MRMEKFKSMADIDHEVELNALQLKLSEANERSEHLLKMYNELLESCNRLLDKGLE